MRRRKALRKTCACNGAYKMLKNEINVWKNIQKRVNGRENLEEWDKHSNVKNQRKTPIGAGTKRIRKNLKKRPKKRGAVR